LGGGRHFGLCVVDVSECWVGCFECGVEEKRGEMNRGKVAMRWEFQITGPEVLYILFLDGDI
jgi:hypothetical protein